MAEVLGAVTSNGLAATVAEVRVTATSNRDQRDPACTDLTLVRSGIVETISTCRPDGGKWFGVGTTIMVSMRRRRGRNGYNTAISIYSLPSRAV